MDNWKKNLYAIWIAEFLAIVGFSTSYPIIPFYLQDLGVTDPVELKFWVGLCTTGASLSLALFAPIWGALADNYGRKLMLLRAMFGGSLVIALMGFVWSPAQLFVLRVIQGILSGTVAAATVLVATTVPEKHAGYALGLLHTAIFIGGSVGPMIGGIISDFFGHRVNFFVTAGFLVLAGVVIARFVHEDFNPLPRTGHILRAVIPDFSPLKESRELLVLVIVAGCVQAANQVSTPMLPLFIQSMERSVSLVASTTGIILGSAALASALAAAFIGKASFRIGYRRTLLVCLLGAGLFAIPQGFSSGPVALLVFRVFAGMCIGGTMPSINAMIVIRTEQTRRGSIFGITASVNSAGAALGPALGSLIALGWGYAATLFGTSFILFATCFIILLCTRVAGKKT